MTTRRSGSSESFDTVSTTGDGKELSFQFGMERDMVVFEGKDMESLRELAGAFIESKFPLQTRAGMVENILLFKHNYLSPSQLELVSSVDSLNNGDNVEVVLKVTFMMSDFSEIRAHMLYVHSYKSPTFCDHCGVMLFGLVRQGLKCEGCGGNFHKRCAFKIPNNCTGDKPVNGTPSPSSLMPRRVSEQWSMTSSDSSTMSLAGHSVASAASLKERRATWSGNAGRPAELDRLVNKLEIPHTFVIHTYKRPTVCQVCKKLLRGLFRQGYQCKDCKFNCHKRCVERAPRNCLGEISVSDRGDSISDDTESTADSELGPELEEEEAEGGGEAPSPTCPNGNDPLEPTMSNQIPLQRIAMSVRHKKNRGSKILKAGWMVHFKTLNTERAKKLHYWRLDTKNIRLFENDQSEDPAFEIPLSDVFSVDSNLEPMGSRHGRNPYLFTLTTSNEIFYCGERDDFDDNGAIIPANPKSGKGTRIAISWAEEIKSAYQSVAATAEASNMMIEKNAKVEQDRKTATDEKDSVDDESEEKDISQVYQVFPDEILGSGQFGVVYGGVHRKTGGEVAVKVIDKFRFPTKEERALKNEVIILQKIDHNAVVNLEAMFETPERIFVVMQKMRGDMLEMILNSPKGRLSERQTKFIVHQILVALHFLHQLDIVHCDLKPENVLLSGTTSKGGLPQIKLCDFGFARIIGSESFRKSVVGTPAYLAPEVLNNRKYNRSLDMWSVGVIIYVSVSGTFPFNEEEEIADQIKNAAFMYPPNPWNEISMKARDLIDKLLQVKMKNRLTCQQALLHVWMQDYNTYLELRTLEDKVSDRYLTHEEDDEEWSRYGASLGQRTYRDTIPEERSTERSERMSIDEGTIKRLANSSISYL